MRDSFSQLCRVAARSALAAGLAVTGATMPVQAQATVTNPPNTQEYGIDAGATFGLGWRICAPSSASSV